MKSIAATAMLLLALVSTTYAQDHVEFYADVSMISCNIVDNAPQVIRVYMFHTGTTPARGVMFRALTPACWSGATWLGDVVNPQFTKGDATHSSGLLVQYPACIAPPGYLGYMNFAAYGQGAPCCQYPPVATEGATTIRVQNCDIISFRTATGRRAIINGNANCPCEQPVPAAETTWGRIKALYQ